MIRSLNRLAAAILICFLAVAVTLGYWSVLASDTLTARQDNPRRVEREQGLWRGGLYDRNAVLLSWSIPGAFSLSGKPVLQREYAQPIAASAVGYYSLVHGVGGAEEAFDSLLRGDDRVSGLDQAWGQAIHQPQHGADIRLTIDLSLETRLAIAMQPYSGAAVVVEVPTGAIRALVSVPSFNPNTLDQNFEALLHAPGSPLLNRATQGLYQPGGALQPIILSALLAKGAKLNDALVGADQPLELGALRIACASQPGSVDTIQDAFSFACPAFFAQAMEANRTEIQTAFEAFGLTRAPRLVNFRTLAGPPVAPLYALPNDSALLQAQGAGQGALLVTPLQMAQVAAALANHGNAVALHMADAVRLPGADWITMPLSDEQPSVIPREVAEFVRKAMADSVQRGTAQPALNPAATPAPTLFGHASFAVSGQVASAPAEPNARNRTVSWFIGFVDRADGTSLAIAIVLEDTHDPSAAARIGGIALR